MGTYTELEGPTGNFAKFNEPGDAVEGRIVSFSLDAGRDFNGEKCPQLIVEVDGENTTVTVGQANLKGKVVANSERFLAGADVKILYTGDEESKNGFKVKQFKVGIGEAPKPALDEL